MSDERTLRAALELIGTTCQSFTGRSRCTDVNSGRSPYARYGADRWCDQCITWTALEGHDFPQRYASGVEELPDPGLRERTDTPT